jgi:hypothetical protein
MNLLTELTTKIDEFGRRVRLRSVRLGEAPTGFVKFDGSRMVHVCATEDGIGTDDLYIFPIEAETFDEAYTKFDETFEKAYPKSLQEAQQYAIAANAKRETLPPDEQLTTPAMPMPPAFWFAFNTKLYVDNEGRQFVERIPIGETRIKYNKFEGARVYRYTMGGTDGVHEELMRFPLAASSLEEAVEKFSAAYEERENAFKSLLQRQAQHFEMAVQQRMNQVEKASMRKHRETHEMNSGKKLILPPH